jgi:hypothetical protein
MLMRINSQQFRATKVRRDFGFSKLFGMKLLTSFQQPEKRLQFETSVRKRTYTLKPNRPKSRKTVRWQILNFFGKMVSYKKFCVDFAGKFSCCIVPHRSETLAIIGFECPQPAQILATCTYFFAMPCAETLAGIGFAGHIIAPHRHPLVVVARGEARSNPAISHAATLATISFAAHIIAYHRTSSPPACRHCEGRSPKQSSN